MTFNTINLQCCTFRQEHFGNDLIRYYLEIDGNKFYLMVTSDRRLTTLNANDLVLGSQMIDSPFFNYKKYSYT